jgi:hypothetical protein
MIRMDIRRIPTTTMTGLLHGDAQLGKAL